MAKIPSFSPYCCSATQTTSTLSVARSLARLPAVTDLSSPLAGSLGLSHSTTDTANYLHALSSTEKGGGVEEEEEGGTQRPRGCVPALRLAVHQTFSPSLFSPSSFPTCLFIFHIQQMKTNTPRLPLLLPPLYRLSFFCINSFFVSPQRGALPLSHLSLFRAGTKGAERERGNLLTVPLANFPSFTVNGCSPVGSVQRQCQDYMSVWALMWQQEHTCSYTHSQFLAKKLLFPKAYVKIQ